MERKKKLFPAFAGLFGVALATLHPDAHLLEAAPIPRDNSIAVRPLMNTVSSDGANSVRIAKDPRNATLYYLKFNGNIYRVDISPGENTSTSSLAYTAADHGISASAQGMAIGPDGAIYVVGNTTTSDGNSTYATIVKGVLNGTGNRSWSLLAQTDPYPRSRTAFDHVFNGVIASLDGNYIYVNSGSRTDHGEVQSVGGLFPNTREVPLTAKIFRLPANGSGLHLPNDLSALRSAGFVFVEGTRNAFDFAFSPDGELFAPDNGPDRDMSDELNWLRPGLHYGFPWRIGGTDNPQQFPNYDPSQDRLLDPRFVGVYYGYYYNDPNFPQATNSFVEPVVNVGLDADKYRDPSDGSIKDASDLDQTISTFTAHRTPLGLVFDTVGAMAPPYQRHGFILSFTPGDANGTNVAGPFYDSSQDLLDLDLMNMGNTNYQASARQVVNGFAMPIDAEIIGNRIYVLEYGGNQGLWEVTFPAVSPNLVLSAPRLTESGHLTFLVTGAIPGQHYIVQTSTNLSNWTFFGEVVAQDSQFEFTDPATASDQRRFYRVMLD